MCIRDRDESDHVRVASDGLGGEIFVHHGMSCQIGQTVWVAVRPEKMRLERARPHEALGPDGIGGAAQGVVEDIAYMGGLSHYGIRLASGQRIRVTLANRDRYAETAPTWEEEVWISWPSGAGVALLS